MTDPVAALPMYDRPEIRGATDRLWAAIRDRLRAAGIGAPEALDRARDPWAVWTDPGLVLAQTCGLPFATRLRGRVLYVATPAYDLPDCPPGWYRSVLIVSPRSRAETPADLAGARPAVNALDSQSGHAALLTATAGMARAGGRLAAPLVTGAHAASIAAVAAGRADLAAIDAVTWELARRHDAAAARVRVLARTEPVPGLPLVTGTGHDPVAVAAAVEAAFAALAPEDGTALAMTGLARLGDAAYASLGTRFRAARAAHGLDGA